MKPIHHVLKNLIFTLLLSLLAFLYGGIPAVAIAAPLTTSSIAQATISDPAGKSKLTGNVTFTATSKGTLIQATVNNAPSGFHGFHIHEKGSCKDNGNAAGGHFNPDNVAHGKLIVDGFGKAHAGDLGNILIATDGTGSLVQTVPGLSLDQGKYAIANHAVIVHAQRDDFGQPTGNAGGRIGCGVISLSDGFR
ncbi:superoxide dismutase family protein [Kovacikia minuta CCNUW1]|uniref:superoxide dismutase family protein n=1 Tax=Kovacikia minuta TaxID=2931930 RepID=UPI001CCD65CE|nr:superoxide dismutase family protein [Kovacikia minuta]UBF25925.1 superoxide dismutase family protein [Kovacikia minuta CCNUW1]